MSDTRQTPPEAVPERIKFTARLTLDAYDAIAEIQKRYRGRTGKALPLWKVLDAAIIAYARAQGISTDDR